MEFKRSSLADISTKAPITMSRRERLARWRDLLAREPARMLKTLEEIEFRPAAQRAALRADNSPLSVAFTDPVLRGEGLKGDTLGDAIAFFDISEHQAHRVVCSCLNGRSITAGQAAKRVRGVMKPLARDRGGSRHGRGGCGAGGPAAVLTPGEVARPRRRLRSPTRTPSTVRQSSSATHSPPLQSARPTNRVALRALGRAGYQPLQVKRKQRDRVTRQATT